MNLNLSQRNLKRSWIPNIVKFALSFLLIFWLVDSGRLDFETVVKAVKNPVLLIAGFLSVSVMVFLSFLRWYFLLYGQDSWVPIKKIVCVGLIGNFFSIFIPGSVGGDLAKTYYISSFGEKINSTFVYSVVFDRYLALTAAFLLLSVMGVFNVDLITKSHISLVLPISCFVTIALITFPVVSSFLGSITNSDQHSYIIHKVIDFTNLVLDANSRFIRKSAINIVCFSISILILFILGLSFLCFGNALGESRIDYSIYLFFGLLVIISMVIPITPAGIGVGQVTGYVLMYELLERTDSFGANLVTLLHLSRIVIAIFGGFVYITYRKANLDTGNC